jgi:carbamate kinase
MRIVVALGGNALLRRGEAMTPEAQHTNVRVAAQALADLARDHQIIVAHGNGPQVGLMALQAAAYAPQSLWPLDILGAETEGMIGYLIEQELVNALPAGAHCATLLTRVEVDRDDPAFLTPTKPIGPVYTAEEAKAMQASHDWHMTHAGEGKWRRVVPSPLPKAILGLHAIRLLVAGGVCVICAGGGGIPVMRKATGGMEGVEAVIDKDRTAALLATALLGDITPEAIEEFRFDAGSMGPKVASACSFVRGGGTMAGVGRLTDARAIVEGHAGTRISNTTAPNVPR